MVVKHLNSKGYERLLIIGRVHMQQWSPTVMAEIRSRAKVFLIDNL